MVTQILHMSHGFGFIITCWLTPPPPSTHTPSTLNADFTVQFGEIFNIRIVQWPETIKLQVYTIILTPGVDPTLVFKPSLSFPPLSLSPSFPPLSLSPSFPPSFLPSFLPPSQVYEVGLLSSSLMAEVYVPIPDSQLTSATPTMVKGFQFSCNKTASYTHTAVGSGQ